MDTCLDCGRDQDEAVAAIEMDDGKAWFAGFDCVCGRRFWYSYLGGREITELEWRMGKIAKQQGYEW